MLDSINLGMAGLMSFSKGLKLVANNTTNLNTPGFKASTARFEEMLRPSPGAWAGEVSGGGGVQLSRSASDLRPGDFKQTGRSLDLAIDGDGFFTLRDERGTLQFTRAGQFRFDPNGVLVDARGATVCAMGTDGTPSEISIAGKSVIPGDATRRLIFSGNVSSAANEAVMASALVVDATGVEHSVQVRFTKLDEEPPGGWTVEILEGDAIVGSTRIVFADGRPAAGSEQVELTFAPAGGPGDQTLILDFSTDVTSFASGSLSSLRLASQDGVMPGALTEAHFDDAGTLNLVYSNGKVRKEGALLLAHFKSPETAVALGGTLFVPADAGEWLPGTAGQGGIGAVLSGTLELSNVDLSREFSELVVMQRGYQASSQVVSTANEMLQELFAMKNR